MKTLLFLLLTFSTAVHAQYISVDADGNLINTSSGSIARNYGGQFDEAAFRQFDEYAKYTGGQMGFCPQFDHLPNVLDGLLDKILTSSKKKQDVVLALDVTGSMGDEIEAVKKNLIRLVEQLSQSNSNQDIEVAIVLYRDDQDAFLTKIVIDLSNDLGKISQNLKSISVAGGGDHREAVLDAIETIESDIHFRLNSNKTIILIGDAPGHLKSKRTGKSTNQVLSLLTRSDKRISINPILVTNMAGSSLPRDLPTCHFCFEFK